MKKCSSPVEIANARLGDVVHPPTCGVAEYIVLGWSMIDGALLLRSDSMHSTTVSRQTLMLIHRRPPYYTYTLSLNSGWHVRERG